MLRSLLVSVVFGITQCSLMPYAAAHEMPGLLGALRMPVQTSDGRCVMSYADLHAYDRPDGTVIGTVKFNKPREKTEDGTACSEWFSVSFAHLKSKAAIPVQTIEVSYEIPGVAAFAKRRTAAESWIKARSEAGQEFWIVTPAGAEYLSLAHDLVQDLERLPEICTAHGTCTPVPPSVQQLAHQAGQSREDTCYGNAYDIEEVLMLPSGRWAYRVNLAESLVPRYGDQLPKKALVPTHDREGAWTGFYFSRGC